MADIEHVNDVKLVGRLSGEAAVRVLPSGDELASFRVVVQRGDGAVDTIDCVAFRADVRKKIGRWNSGDIVEVDGAMRRRFWRSGSGPASRTEVEVARIQRVAQAA